MPTNLMYENSRPYYPLETRFLEKIWRGIQDKKIEFLKNLKKIYSGLMAKVNASTFYI